MTKIGNRKTSQTPRVVHATMWIMCAIAAALFYGVLTRGDQTYTLFSLDIYGRVCRFGFKFDDISAPIFSMVVLLGAMISKYSLRYLSTDRRELYFYKYFTVTVASSSVLVLSNNLVQFFIAWIFSSYGLHKLLLYYPEREQARSAAWKKFFVSRLGDLALLSAIALTFRTFGTLEFDELFHAANSLPAKSPESAALSLASIFFVLGAVIKSAQYPFHFWLPETMETPTPVSAIMHAGVINAGGFLVIRLSPLLQHAEAAHFILTICGSITAIYGALVMITQNDIKKKLAYSTISQMGIMMVACGLGAYSIALLHIIAHSFYKAHAFLSTGFLVNESKKQRISHTKPPVAALIIGSALGYVAVVSGSVYADSIYLSYITYASILLLGFIQNLDPVERHTARITGKPILTLFGVFLISLGIWAAAETFLYGRMLGHTPILWGEDENVTPRLLISLLSYSIFVIGLILSTMLTDPRSVFAKKLYIYFWNGGYFSQRSAHIFNFFTQNKG